MSCDHRPAFSRRTASESAHNTRSAAGFVFCPCWLVHPACPITGMTHCESGCNNLKTLAKGGIIVKLHPVRFNPFLGRSVLLRTRKLMYLATFLSIPVLFFACAGPPKNPSLARQCDRGLSKAFKELESAKAKGFSGTVNWVKASSLLAAARVQQEFGKSPNCVDKVKRARYYIKEGQRAP